MGLRNQPIPQSSVGIPGGGSFTVRGFSFDDAVGLYYRHRGELSALFDEFATKKTEVADVAAVGKNLLSGAPLIMAEIIAIAAGGNPVDEDDFAADVAVARQLGAAVQMDAIEKIGSLTFSSEMPPPKFLAVVLKMAQGATAAMGQAA